MAFPALAQAEGKLKAKQDELAAIFREAGPDLDMSLVKSVPGDNAAKVAHVRALNEELDTIGADLDGLRAVAQAAERARELEGKGRHSGAEDGADGGMRHGNDGAQAPRDLGALITASQAYKGRQRGGQGPVATLDVVEVKTLFETTAGWLPETTRTGRVVDYAVRPVQILDVIPTTQTTQNAVVYMEETTFTNNAAEVAEGGTYAESALALTEKTSSVRKIGTWLPVTDEQLEDEPQARGYLNNRLPFMLRQRLDGQVLVGNGTAPNLRGVLNVAGISTQAKGSDPVPDAVYKAIVAVRVTGRALPSAYVTHPTDWQDVRLLRTADGVYIWGNPSEAGPERIWGLQVVQSDAITLNTGLVGDFANFSELSFRRGVDVQISNSHDVFFVNGKQAIRADVRAAFVVYRPAAFCTVTGI